MKSSVDQSEKTPAQPRYIRVDARDNVAIVVNPGGLRAGSVFPCGLVLVEPVPEAHKVALSDLAEGAPVMRYGVAIGYAKQPIARGSWVHEGLLNSPSAPPLGDCPLATAVPAPPAKLEGYTFEGYRNADGTVGTKNILAISTTVQCVAATVNDAVKRIKADLLPLSPDVDDGVAMDHHYGCAWLSTRPALPFPFALCATSASIPTSAVKCWWSVWAARSCSPRA